MALALNVTYAWPHGPVVIGIGIAAPLVLPLVLWIRSTFSVTGFWRCTLRELCTLAVAAPAVAISYWHTASLMLAHQQPWVLALLAPLSADGVAGLSTMALHRSAQEGATAAVAGVGAAAAADSDATSDELVSQRDELRERRASHQRDEVLERARELAATGMSIRAIAHEVGISRTTLTRKLAATGG
jgi:hypothetical protein